MLADSLLVTTVAVTDLERAKKFFGEQLACRSSRRRRSRSASARAHGGQFSVRRGQPNVGQTVGHFEVADSRR